MDSPDQTSLHTLPDGPLPPAPAPAPTGEAPLGLPAEKPASSARGWILLAVASGACAAFNGMFAKLTTTDLTRTIADAIGEALGLGYHPDAVEYLIRGLFFVLNLVFNGVMWSLYTSALKKGSSTTQVAIMNTSMNFMVTAVLGALVFSEALPPLWWAGAALLVAGNVILGREAASSAADEGEMEGEGREAEQEREGLLERSDDGEM
ncbi:uncharacterized protein DNG_02427 [Cephalotrichum gorgonifer]|uniref:EamA domain-containing protein n=1 Tax=Cephalotrichum gorgonifer TaxID=2041049 RepID=A0AAE8ST22_9PEZI|nr:uncharacterized protein DNG_02427 [Cephalotrichum gorgonifer]